MTLELGDSGPAVRAWQRFIGARVDGDFGPETKTLTQAFQTANGIDPDGVVGPETRAAADKGLPFIQAKNYTKGRYGSPVTVIVIHTMQSQEKPSTAINVAKWFAGDQAPQASAHFCVDATDTIQCVQELDTSWGAPGANRNGLHIEHAGRAEQTSEQWSDAYSESMLVRSAALCADLCRKHGVPIKRIGPAELVAGARGICGHVDVTNAFHKGDHTDPGPNFPWAHYLALVMAAAS